MPRVIDFKKKAEELRSILEKYNGIPTFKEDRVAYANVCYYIKNHSDKPEIKALIDEYNLAAPINRKSEDYFKNRLEEIKSILERYQRIPKGENEKKDYQTVYYFFNHYKDDPEVIKMMDIYTHPDSFYKVTGRSLYTNQYSGRNRPNCNFESAYKYIKYVYERYNVLPARRTLVIYEVRKHFRRKYPFKDEEKYQALEMYKSMFPFFREMSELGCPDEELFQFMTIEKSTD